ncbi:TonB-dependent receptor [Rugamonas sp. FT107W]|uniref:TonB-dependent receptor n=1 Tax=Duganella vulcania TaxID=2692166 RepID=A0A845HBK9_9BURK|nr:TonB-dependent receptor [Duganella vulcania]MYN16141.1 TonB-dependent receptor [Duganella vulcania]
MQSAVKHNPTLRLSLVALACQMVCMGAAYAQSDAAPAAKPATETVTITGRKVGMGLMVQEDVPKARSTVTAEELSKQRPTGNAYDALTLMPAVNTYSYDGTGLFGGGLTLRGFNSDQIGATINGVPVNDSGNFAVFPQEFVDQENTCTTFVTQGSTDVDSPQVGATGGNFGITTCDPEDKQRFRIMQTGGQLSSWKTYLRFDSGKFANDKAKVFVSVSHAEAKKWKGLGKAMRDHMDVGFNYDWDRFNYIHGTVLYNRAINNNISTFTLADLKKNGYFYDYGTVFTGRAAPSPGKAGNDVLPANGDVFYKLSLNPFENVIASAIGKFRLNDTTDIKIVPYYWYGYGTGGSQEKLMSESGFLNPATGKLSAGVDLNGDGDTLDKVLVSSSSVTRTQRPGITTSVIENIGDHQILAGVWYERANHRQTGPMTAIDTNGNPADAWFRDNLIHRPDGSLYESRDWKTISTAYQGFVQDTISLGDKVLVNVGVRMPHVKRDFTNYPNEGFNSGTGYSLNPSYKSYLPQFGVRYRITNDDQIFASYAKNFRAPPNFVFATTGNNVAINPAGQAFLASAVKPETSWDLDVGYRHQDSVITTSATVFFIDYKNRQANATDANTLTSTYTNVGNVKNKGFEFELGNTPVNGFSVYGSLGYLKTEMQNDLAAGLDPATKALIYLPITGKQFPLAPKWKTGLVVSYETDSWYVRMSGKYTGRQQATLMNDEEVPGYTLVGLDAAYQFPSWGAFKNPKLSLNVSNLTNRQFRNPTGLKSNALAYGTIKADSAVAYYMGAPRLMTATLRVDF